MFGVYFDKGTHEDLFKTLKPGTMYRIFGVYEQAFTDKYPIINIS